jgi:H+-translocating NAD(P) transhydrogenase subunit beta
MRGTLIELAYLVSAIAFIVGIKGLAHPRTAVRGNAYGALGMLIAVVAVLFDRQVVSFTGIIAGIVAGGAVGAVLARRIEMTAMPQLVAVFNGFGGLASALVAGAELVRAHQALGAAPASVKVPIGVAIAATALIGAVTFTGSTLAFAKLQGLLGGATARLPGGRTVSAVLALAALGLGAALVAWPSPGLLAALGVVAAVLGLVVVLPIGGADMPVVIALLNSYSGLAAAAAGFVLGNTALVVSGSLVGASGLILTSIMCRAMNRSLLAVLFGGAPAAGAGDTDELYAGTIKETSADEVAMLLEGARRVVIVPGYGMAVAQAQHAVSDLVGLVEQCGARVEFAIHPVAGRMPGHMNVLLAEADIPYDQLVEMEAINPSFPQVDVVIVIGANDVVNPAARSADGGPIAGMPILDVDQARTVVVIKRSLSPGFTGIANPLFAADNTLMLFADGKQAILDIAAAVDAELGSRRRLAS